MTQEEHETAIALANAQMDFLRARGWVLSRGHHNGLRCSHHNLTLLPNVGIRDALELTRVEPLRYRKQGQ